MLSVSTSKAFHPLVRGMTLPGLCFTQEPQSVVGYWWALEDCTLSNGCLWAVPGSHRTVVKRRFKRSSTVRLQLLIKLSRIVL